MKITTFFHYMLPVCRLRITSAIFLLTTGAVGHATDSIQDTGTKAASTSSKSIAAKELIRRQELTTTGDVHLKQAQQCMDNADYTGAMQLYRQALELFPDAPASAARRKQAEQGYAQAMKAAETAAHPLGGEGFVSTNVGTPGNPDNAQVQSSVVAQIKDALTRGRSAQSLGALDQADGHLRQALRLDPYNQAARQAMAQGEHLRSGYSESARDHHKSASLSVIDAQWEEPVPAVDVSHLFGSAGTGIQEPGALKKDTLRKLRTIVIPIVDFDSVGLVEVVEFLRARSRDLDPERKGVDFVLHVPADVQAKPITLRLASVPLEEVLRQATGMIGVSYQVDEHAVLITSQADMRDVLISRQYRVSGDFFQTSPMAPPDAGTQGHRIGARELLIQRGVPFPPEAAASYNPATNILLVRNTAENLLLVDALAEQAAGAAAKQVEIQVRMIAVSESRLKELGFDWLLGQFNVPGSDRIFSAGGGQPLNGEVLPFPGRAVTNGLRNSADLGKTSLFGIPALTGLAGQAEGLGANAKAPGFFAVSGVFSDPQFQMVLRGLSQEKGMDMLASPTIFAKSGQRSAIRLVREFRYPTQYDAAQVPQSSANSGPITPATPTEFEKRDVGIMLEVEPVIGDNGVLDINLAPSLVEFEGFVDYGHDFVNSAQTGPLGQPAFYRVPNRILQPVFQTNRLSTTVSVWNGSTVVLGGVAYERTQKLDDKVPVVGNLPLVGRAFQSKVRRVDRTNILFFVTARIVDPGGNKVATGSAYQGPD